MSYTSLYVAREDGVMEDAGNFDAGSSFCAGFWIALSREYLGLDSAPLKQMQPLWDLVESEAVPLAYRIVLATMFDRALLQPEDFSLVACSLAEVRMWYRPIEAVGAALSAMGRILVELRADPTVRAVGFRWTSVAEDLWWVREGEEDGLPYSLLTDTGHTWLREIL